MKNIYVFIVFLIYATLQDFLLYIYIYILVQRIKKTKVTYVFLSFLFLKNYVKNEFFL